jgi:hypothetical protein
MAIIFKTLNDNADPTFNQDLGINDKGEIAGYFGSGTPATVHPNKGYTLTPNYNQGDYHNENFPGSNQTQVTGLNNWGLTVGFWADPNGDNFGFAEYHGHFEAIFDPNAPTPVWGTPSVQQLLGVNDYGRAAGFYTDANGNNHGFVFDIAKGSFDAVNVAGFSSVTATGINNAGDVSGFVSNGGGSIGFVREDSGRFDWLTGPQGASNIQALGLNNEHQVVGSFVGSDGNTHGFLYSLQGHNYVTIDDPNAAGSTVANGLNDKGQVVGFYLDHAGNTDGMLVQFTGDHKSS